MKKFRCKVCGFIYNPAENNNTAFEDLSPDWKCPVCGAPKQDFEEIHHKGEEQTGGEAQEKHVPVISEGENGSTVVKVGAIPHPMLKEHQIMWVELREGNKSLKKIDLTPGNPPVAIFEGIPFKPEYTAIEFCNLHGLWES